MDGFRNPSSTFTGSETAANLNSGNAKSVTVTAKWTANCNDGLSSVGSYKNFDYTGSVQTFNACAGRTYKLEVWGAQGGTISKDNKTGDGGYGGYAYGNYNASINSVFYIAVGGSGVNHSNGCSGTYNGGFNGGGTSYGGGGSGGGATHIATRTGVLSSLSSYQSTVLIVAGGGGGAGNGCFSPENYTSGSGGGYIGGNGLTKGGTTTATGGTQSSGGSGGSQSSSYDFGDNGSFGKGGNGNNDGSGDHVNAAGGGGWYGGGGSHYGPAAGGSGYIGNSSLSSKGMYMYSTGCTSSTATTTKTTCTSSTGAHVANAANTGNGYAKITRQS